MCEFEKAVEFVLAHEGGLSENVNDSGGTTNFGISARFLREVKDERLRKYGIFTQVNEDTIRLLTIEQAKLIYKGEFWDGNHFDEIYSQCVCNYLFDMAVNIGNVQAVKILQRGCIAATFTRGCLSADGLMGENTIGLVNSLGEKLLPVLVAIRAEFYRNLVANRPKDEIFLDGWLNRTYAAI